MNVLIVNILVLLFLEKRQREKTLHNVTTVVLNVADSHGFNGKS